MPNLCAFWFHGWWLTIKLSHLFTQLNLSKDSLELGLVDTCDKPACHIGVRLTEGRLKDLQGTKRRKAFWRTWWLKFNYRAEVFFSRGVKVKSVQPCVIVCDKPACRARAWSRPQWHQQGWPSLPPGKYGCSGVGSVLQGPSSHPPWPALWPKHTQTEEWLCRIP